MVDMIDVESSNIDAVGYDEHTMDLYVRFKNNSEYKYLGVPKEHFDGLVGASSVGQYLNQQIKPSYSFERIV